MKRHCLTLDLKADEASIKAYDDWHTKVWPQVIHNIISSGIKSMEIYRVGNRLFMIMEVSNSFSFEKKAKVESSNKRVQEWEALMLQYQQPLPFAKPGEKWVLMNKIFDLNQQ